MDRLRRWTRPALALVCVAAAACSDGPTSPPPDGAVDLALPWSVVTPESVGMDGNALFVAGEVAGRIDRMRSLIVVRDGRLAYERYYGGWTADTLADVRSVTKSVVGTLVGIAAGEGRLDLDDPITDWLDASEHATRAEHGGVTVRHLLTMTGGFEWLESGAIGYADWYASANRIDYLLERSLADTPGTRFTYNSAAVHLLGIVLEAATGMSVPEYADRTLLGPLGITRRRWEDLGDGSVNGGAGLDLRPRDLARLGQLMLQEGWSGGRSVVPPEWVGEATAARLGALGGMGPIETLSYGYLFWIDVDNGAFLAWGYGGQFIYVDPDQRLVVVATTEWRLLSQDLGSARLQRDVLSIVVDRVVPAAR